MSSTSRNLFTLIFVLLLAAACQSGVRSGTPDYPVTIIASTGVPTTAQPQPSHQPQELIPGSTIDWQKVTLLPLPTAEPSSEAMEARAQADRTVPDPLTEADLDLLTAGQPPFALSSREISLGWVVLPVDLFQVAEMGAFRIQSIPVDDYPEWRFLAFDLPIPEAGELGVVVRAPISGMVMGGTMRMVSDEVAQTVSVDHSLSEGRLLRATLVYTGTIEPLFVARQEVQAGDVLFRLTRDTGRIHTLGSTPIPGGATMTLHASIDTVNRQPSGVDALKFLRGVSLTPAGFLKDEAELVVSPVN